MKSISGQEDLFGNARVGNIAINDCEFEFEINEDSVVVTGFTVKYVSDESFAKCDQFFLAKIIHWNLPSGGKCCEMFVNSLRQMLWLS